MGAGEEWYKFALREIERSSRRMTEQQKNFIQSVKPRIELGMSLSEKQEKFLLSVHEKMTGVGVGYSGSR